MSVTAEFAALQRGMDELKAKIEKQSQEAADGSMSAMQIVEKLAEKYAHLSHTRKAANAETRYYPMWKPLDFETYSANWGALGNSVGMKIAQAVGGRDGQLVQKAVDSTAVGPLIRQDLEQTLYEVFVKRFPLLDMVRKEPANGLVHAWNQKTGYGDAQFITELGTVVDDASTYSRQTTNMAVLATRRGISLKAKFAVTAGGMNYDAEQEEITSGLTAMAHKAQVGICRLQDVDNTSTTATAANGLFDANAFNGLRYILQNLAPGANTITVDGTVAVTAGTHPITDAVQAAANALIDAGGSPSIIIASVAGRQKVISEQTSFVRFDVNNSTEIIPGLRVPKIVAGDSELPVMVVPGDSMGTYIIAGQTFVDLYILDLEQVAWAYLGAAGPNVIEVPLGVDGTLRHLYIPYMMGGLVPYVPQFMARVKIRIA